MPTVFRRELMTNTNLTCIKTDKFKTGCISVTLMLPLTSSTAAKNALLPRVLRRGGAHHPDMESIAAALDDLYGAQIEYLVRKKGETQCVTLYCDFVDDDLLPKGSHILEDAAGLLCELLLTPKTRGGQLLGEYVDSEKEKLIEEILAEKNSKDRYALSRLIEQMCSGESYGVSRLGTESSVNRITAAALTKHYREIIKTAPIEIFYCGSASHERVEAALLSSLAALPRSGSTGKASTKVLFEPVKPNVRKFTDRLDVVQGKLVMGFRLGEAMKRPNYAALLVFNELYGGAVTSKLFMNVRERLSLCYYAASSIDKHKGVMIVRSGIEFGKYDEAVGEILSQLEAVKTGDITPWELDGAKKSAVTMLKSAMDRPARIEDIYLDNILADIDYSPEDMAALVGEVTAEQITELAAGIKCDSIYFLAGKEETEDEA